MRERSSKETLGTYEYPGCNWESWKKDSNGKFYLYSTWSSSPSTLILGEKALTMVDVVTKDFKKRSARGEIINNPMTQILEETHSNAVTYKWTWEDYVDGKMVGYGLGDGDRYSAATFVCGAIPDHNLSINRQSVIDRAVTSAHANCDLSEVAILATLGEAKETVVSLVQILARVWKIFRAIKRLDIRVLKGELKPSEVADRYMEYRYALRPLYYDAKQICNALTADGLKEHDRQTFRGYAEDHDTASGTYDLSLSDYRRSSVSYEIKKQISARAGVLCRITSSSRALTWGAFNIPQTMWELTPFSFILDWFINIGDVIGSFSPKAGLEELSSWVVVEETTTYSQEGILSGINTATKKTFVSGANRAEVTSSVLNKERIVNPPRGILPRVDVNLDPLKLLDLHLILNKLRK